MRHFDVDFLGMKRWTHFWESVSNIGMSPLHFRGPKHNLWHCAHVKPVENKWFSPLQAQEERNYHIFYCMLAGITAEERKSLHLKNAQDYIFLTKVWDFFFHYYSEYFYLQKVFFLRFTLTHKIRITQLSFIFGIISKPKRSAVEGIC